MVSARRGGVSGVPRSLAHCKRHGAEIKMRWMKMIFQHEAVRGRNVCDVTVAKYE